GLPDGGYTATLPVCEAADMAHAAAAHADDGDAQGVAIALARDGLGGLGLAAGGRGAGQDGAQQRGITEKITPVDRTHSETSCEIGVKHNATSQVSQEQALASRAV